MKSWAQFISEQLQGCWMCFCMLYIINYGPYWHLQCSTNWHTLWPFMCCSSWTFIPIHVVANNYFFATLPRRCSKPLSMEWTSKAYDWSWGSETGWNYVHNISNYVRTNIYFLFIEHNAEHCFNLSSICIEVKCTQKSWLLQLFNLLVLVDSCETSQL